MRWPDGSTIVRQRQRLELHEGVLRHIPFRYISGKLQQTYVHPIHAASARRVHPSTGPFFLNNSCHKQHPGHAHIQAAMPWCMELQDAKSIGV